MRRRCTARYGLLLLLLLMATAISTVGLCCCFADARPTKHRVLAVPPPANSPPPIIVCGCDGLSDRAVAASAGFVPILAQSEYTLRARTVEHTRSSEAWRAIFMGGYDSGVDVSPARPGLFRHIKSQNSTKSMWVIWSYSVIKLATDPSGSDYSKNQGGTVAVTDRYLEKKGTGPAPDLAVLYFYDTDGAGHNVGWGTDAYNEAVEVEAAQIMRLRAAVPEAIIFVVSDHGGRRRGHRYIWRNMYLPSEDIDSPWFRRVPWIRMDPYKPTRPLCDTVRSEDLAVEVARTMNVAPHVSWRSRAGWLPPSFPCTPEDVAPIVSGVPGDRYSESQVRVHAILVAACAALSYV